MSTIQANSLVTVDGAVTVDIPDMVKKDVNGKLIDAIGNPLDGVGSGLDADTVDGVQGALLGIGGAGYVWVDETANRALGITYTNTTGKPIKINVTSTQNSNPTLYIDGVPMSINSSGIGGFMECVGDIIPINSTYAVVNSGGTLTYWFELK